MLARKERGWSKKKLWHRHSCFSNLHGKEKLPHLRNVIFVFYYSTLASITEVVALFDICVNVFPVLWQLCSGRRYRSTIIPSLCPYTESLDKTNKIIIFYFVKCGVKNIPSVVREDTWVWYPHA